MNQSNLNNISEKFIKLDQDKQKKVYEKMLSDGLEMSEFPIPRYNKNLEALGEMEVSYAQQRFWFLWKLDPSSSAYNISGAIKLTGRLDSNAVNQSFANIVKRHSALNTVFSMNDEGKLVAKMQNNAITIEEQQLDLVSTSLKIAIKKSISSWVNQPFDLIEGPLYRIGVFCISDTEFILGIAMHHIVSDGWSVQILVKEFVEEYKAIIKGATAEIKNPEIDYTDYAQWQRQWMQAGELKRQLDYWVEALGRKNPVLELPMTEIKAHQVLTPSKYTISFDADYAMKLRGYVLSNNASLFTLMLNTLQVLLYRYTGQQDIRVGVAVSGRERPESQSIIGLLVNTQVLRNNLQPNWSLNEAFSNCYQQVLAAQEYQQLPFDKLVEELNPERSLQSNPLFQVMFNFTKQQESHLVSLPDLKISVLPVMPEATGVQFDLVMSITDKLDGSLDATFIYADELFNQERISNIASDYRKLLDTTVNNDQMVIGDTLLDQSMEQHYVVENHKNITPDKAFKSIIQVINQQVVLHPNKNAFIFYDEVITFQELEIQSNRLAYHLQNLGVTTETKVGVLLERSISLFISLYAVLKSGGTYVPIDPNYPQQRIDYIIQDSGVKILLSHSDIILNPLQIGVTRFDINSLNLTSSELPELSSIDIHPEQLAYVIYTSGSTGKPKGVAVSHQGIIDHCDSIAKCYTLTEEDVEFHFLSISFDGAQERWITPIITGATVIIRQQELQSIESIIRYIVDNKTTVVALPPSYLHQIVNWIKGLEGAPYHLGIKTYCFAGEAFSRELLKDVITYLKPERIINGYGPTETVVTPTIWRESALEADFTSSYAPIGRLVGNRKAYILDNDLNVVPHGIAGELYLGGLLARGYLNKPRLTCERFIANPFSEDGERLYRTGDLVRWNESKQLEYLGRIDHQIKIRGYRIELGEIESSLNAQEYIKQSVVIAQNQDQSARLVAYVVLADGYELDTQLLQRILKEQLPEYMVPSLYVQLDTIPLNVNGKVDRHKLPAPEIISYQRYEAPKNEREKELAQVWQEVLKVERVGRQDNFFELGGDSIMSLQLISKAKTKGFDIGLRDLFQKSTIASLLDSDSLSTTKEILKINKSKSMDDPLVCIHAVTGTIFDYLPLAQSLEAERSVYAIPCNMPENVEKRHQSLYEMAEHYATLLINTPYIKKYSLVGWSIGGVLALMTASILEERGYIVESVYLIDSYIPPTKTVQDPIIWYDNFVYYANHILKLPIKVSDVKTESRALPTLEDISDIIDTLRNTFNNELNIAYKNMDSIEIAKEFTVSSYLSKLALQGLYNIEKIRAPIQSYWASDRPNEEIEKMNKLLDVYPKVENVIEADHFSILHSTNLLNSFMVK